MSKLIFLVQAFAVVLVFGIFTNCSAQNKKEETQTGAYAVAEVSRPADEAKIEVVIPVYKIEKTDLDYLQSLEMPEINFVFEPNKSKLELPADANSILNSHWKEAIKIFYNEQFNKSHFAQESYNRDLAWQSYCLKTEQKLQKIIIDAPNGKRNIAQIEAGELWAFINRVASNIAQRVKVLKNN